MRLSRHPALATAAAVLALLVAAPPAAAAPGRPPRPLTQEESANWAAQLVEGTPGSFYSVEAEWVQPAVDCNSQLDRRAAFWTGLDVGSGNIEQTGIRARCEDGEPRYEGWYEMLPELPVFYNDPIRSGDRLRARVESLGHREFELVLQDFTQRWNEYTYAKPRDGINPLLNKAEVVAEAPTAATGGIRPLPDFGTVVFQRCKADGLPLGYFDPVTYTMKRDGILRASTGPMTDFGRSFAVTWKHE